MDYYEKSYKGFIIFMVVYCAAMFSTPFLPAGSTMMLVLYLLNVMNIGICALCYIMYKNEKVYWINGVSYEQAKDAGSERRKAFALAYLKIFGKFSAGFVLFCTFLLIIKIPSPQGCVLA